MLAQHTTLSAPRPVLPTAGHPRLTARSPDGDLLAALRRDPGLLHNLYGEAHHAATKLLQNPHWPVEQFGVSAFWTQAQSNFRRAIPPAQIGVAQDQSALDAAGITALRIILDARDGLCGLLADFPHLQHGELLALRGQLLPDGNAALSAQAMARLPGLASWQERRRAVGEAAQAAQDGVLARQQEAAAQHRAEQRIAAAVALLAALAGRGLVLTIRGKGIAAQPAALLTVDDRGQLKDLRDEMLALLASPEELVA